MRTACVCLCLALSACASKPAPKPAEAAADGGGTMATVAQTPLRDVNLVRDGIPEVLTAALGNAYAPPVDGSCDGLAREVTALTAILGTDLDTGSAEREEDVASAILVGAVQGLIPYRSVLRRLSGAHARERRAAAAMAAGSVRRAYLKGLGEQQGCLPPAAPQRQMETDAAGTEDETGGSGTRD